MSSALPCGRPSTTSKITTSPSSRNAASWARTPPMLPPPIRAILLRAILGGSPEIWVAGGGMRRRLRLRLPALQVGLHVGDDGVTELGALELRGAFHQAFEV